MILNVNTRKRVNAFLKRNLRPFSKGGWMVIDKESVAEPDKNSEGVKADWGVKGIP